MADIVTNTLQIGNNNLILRDADAQEKISDLKEDLNESVGELKNALYDNVSGTKTVSVTPSSTGYQNIIINKNLKKGQRIKLFISESEALEESDTLLAGFASSAGSIKNVKLYDEVEYTLPGDVEWVGVSFSKTLIASSGTATLNLVVYSVNQRLSDSEKRIDDAIADINTNEADIDVLESKYETQTESTSISVTQNTLINTTILLPYLKKDRLFKIKINASSSIMARDTPISLSDSSGKALTNETVLPNKDIYVRLERDSTYIRIYISASLILQSGSITLDITEPGIYNRFSIDETNIENLINGVPEAKYLPNSYYFESYTDADGNSHDSYLDYKISRINALAKPVVGNGDAFIFITDEHWTINAKQSPALLNYITQKTHIYNLFSGGDTGEGGCDAFCRALKESWKQSVHHATGNHEYYSGGTNSNLYYMMDMQNNDEVGNPQEHYYYYDNVQAKIRYIILNSDGTSAYSQDQLSWFTTTALDVEQGWGIIIFVHWMYMVNWSNNEVFVGGQYAQAFVDAINSYSGNGEIIAVIQGHVHRDRMLYTKTNGVPVIITSSDKWVTTSTEIGGQTVYDMDVTREPDTVTEQTFDVVIVDRSTKTLTMVRIGGLARNGIDNNPGDEVEERTIQWN